MSLFVSPLNKHLKVFRWDRLQHYLLVLRLYWCCRGTGQSADRGTRSLLWSRAKRIAQVKVPSLEICSIVTNISVVYLAVGQELYAGSCATPDHRNRPSAAMLWLLVIKPFKGRYGGRDLEISLIGTTVTCCYRL
ncbi:hypothetical protein BDV37DRAFT_240635, partial [Aspergillus pseudonomiae]